MFDLQRIGFNPYSGKALDVDAIILDEKAKLEAEIVDEKAKLKPIKGDLKSPISIKPIVKEDDVWQRVKSKIPEEKLQTIERIEDKIKYNGYSQDFDACIRWNGTLVIGQEYDEEGNITNEGEEIEGYFVDVRTENPLPKGFESLMQDTVIDDRYPHRFS